MASPGICPQCGDRLPTDVPHGVCPKCMLQLGFNDLLEGPSAGEQPTLDPGSRFLAPLPADLAAHFPQLEILDLLGQGGMGAVYRARQKTLNRVVALKVLPVEVGRDPAFEERFTREAQSLARLTHPNIVMVFDFGEAAGYFYFLMEYVNGVNLRQALSDGHLTPQQALSIVPQICEALQYAHDEGIVHRDIKPENVLLDKRGNVKIADFGLAKLLGHSGGNLTLTSTGQVMGTPHYMAPEQFEKPTEVDHRADIYSLGVVFYELLTGELPLGRFDPPSEKSGVSAELDQVVLRALEKEPNRRYQQASEVKTAVQSAGDAAPKAVEHAPTVIPENLRRLRVPFTISELYAGFAKASGCIYFNGQEVILEFQVKDDVVGYVSSGIKSVSVPLDEIVRLELVKPSRLLAWLGRSNYMELMAYQMSTLENIPRSEQGRAQLVVSRRDVSLAEQFIAAVQRVMSPGSEVGEPPRPPIVVDRARVDNHEDNAEDAPRQDVDLVERAEALRLPAMGLLLVGILSCITPLVFPVLALIPMSHSLRIPEEPAVAAPVAQPTLEVEESAGHFSPTDLPQPAHAEENVTELSPAEYAVHTEMAIHNSWLLFAIVALAGVLQLALALVIITGAVRMRKLENYGLSMTASVMAALPVHPWFVLGLPIGIWSLMVLVRADTKEAFRLRQRMRRATFQPETPSPKGPLSPAKPAATNMAVAADTFRTPAVSLMSIGIANAMLTVLLGLLLMRMGGGLIGLALLLFALLVSLFQIKGGVHMLRNLSHGVSTVGAVAAILPLTPLWIISLPVGIWALVLLQRPETQQRYADAAAGRWNDAIHRDRPRNWVALTLLMVAGLMVGALAALFAYWFSASPRPEPAHPAAATAPIQTTARNQYWLANEINTVEAWQSVETLFPHDQVYGPLAKQRLAEWYLAAADNQKALDLFVELAALGDSHPQMAAAGFIGQANLYADQRDEGKVVARMRDAVAFVEPLPREQQRDLLIQLDDKVPPLLAKDPNLQQQVLELIPDKAERTGSEPDEMGGHSEK